VTKHSLLADALSSDIQNGKYKVGDCLPSEPELSERYGVSRHTVRVALRTLQGLGLVASQQGVGTRVQETRLIERYAYDLSSAQDLLQYAKSTRVRRVDAIEIDVDEAGAAQLGCKPGERWWRVRTVRSEKSGTGVVAYSVIHIPSAFGAVLKDSPRAGEPFFTMIQKRFHEPIQEIRQDIGCVAKMSAEECRHLKVPPGSPGMLITRQYVGRGGRPLEVARSVHPPEVFKYAMRVQLRRGAGATA
jgi:DNA-binding GntR family transcriptional regulator